MREKGRDSFSCVIGIKWDRDIDLVGGVNQPTTIHNRPPPAHTALPHSGPLAPFVEVRGDWLPRQVLGKFTALSAVLRMLYLALTLGLEDGHPPPDVVFCDGVSAMVPLLRLRGLPVLFYCHFPDKLLCTDRRALLKRLYRWPLDLLEELTTGA